MAKAKKTAAKPDTYETRLATELERFASDRKIAAEPPPCNYFFARGEAVRVGNLDDVRVEDVMEGGNVVVVSYHDRGESYGRPFDNMRRLPRVMWWFEIDPIATQEPTTLGRDERWRTTYLQSTLESVMHSAYRRGLFTTPAYQRGYVWTLEDKQRLIQSVFDQADIGKFIFMCHEWPERRWEVIDGKQRMAALMDFREGRFAFRDKTWFQLSTRDKRIFESLMVQFMELQRASVKDSDVLWLFLSINRAGVPQTEEHIAHVRSLYEQAKAREAATK